MPSNDIITEKLPTDGKSDTPDDTSEWLCFKVADEIYTHEVLSIDEVLRYSEPTPVPGSLYYILGILNIRGSVVSVFSGRALLGLEEKSPDEDSRIVIFRINGENFGVTVDSVVEIAYFNKEMIEDSMAQHQSHAFMKGTINHQDKLLIVVDFSLIE